MAAVGLLVLWPGSAQADTALTGSGPSESETIEVLPAEVFLDLNEEVLDPPSIVVTKSDGTRVNSEIVQVSGRRVTSKIVRDVGPGIYTMNYRVASVDTHSVTGTINFTVTGSLSDPVSPRQDSGEQSRDGVTVEAMPNESSNGGSLMIFVLFVIAMIVMLWFLRTGMRTARASGRDSTVDND
nr:copper resistance CopC family protein [Aeromicrobium stalagmiti]